MIDLNQKQRDTIIMKATAERELAQRFRELLEIPERVNDMGIVETKEMILYCFKTKEGYSQKRWDNITVLDNLLIHYNLKFQGIKLSKEIITNFNFHTAMELLLRGRWEPETIVNLYEKILFEWENKGIGDNTEKQIIKHIIHFFNEMQQPSAQLQGLKCSPEFKHVDLCFIYKKLEGKFGKTVIESNFLDTFKEAPLPSSWQPLQWNGSNPELATLVYRLTGKKPIPSLINVYFKTKTKYLNASSKGYVNKSIIQLIEKTLK